MIAKIGEEFPDIVTTGTFGKTWEDRELKFIKLDIHKGKSKGNSLSESDESSGSSSDEKKDSSSSSSMMSDDDIIKTLGPDVGNVYVQEHQDVNTVKHNLKKNLKLAQVKHIDYNLLKLGDDDDISSGDSMSGSKKEESIKSIS